MPLFLEKNIGNPNPLGQAESETDVFSYVRYENLLLSMQMTTEGRGIDYSIGVGGSEILTLSSMPLHPEKNTGDLYKLPFLKPSVWSSLNTWSQNERMMTREHRLLGEAPTKRVLNPCKLNFHSFNKNLESV